MACAVPMACAQVITERNALIAKVTKWLEFVSQLQPSIDPRTGKIGHDTVYKVRLCRATMPTLPDFEEGDVGVDWFNVRRYQAFPTKQQIDEINDMVSSIRYAGEAVRNSSPSAGSISPENEPPEPYVVVKKLFDNYGDMSMLFQDDSDSGRSTLTPNSTPSPKQRPFEFLAPKQERLKHIDNTPLLQRKCISTLHFHA